MSYPQAYSHLEEVLEGRDDVSPRQAEEILDGWGRTAQRYVVEYRYTGGSHVSKHNIRSKRMRSKNSPKYLRAKYTEEELRQGARALRGHGDDDGRIC